MKHKCRESKICKCSPLADEPNPDCPVHGYPYPRRCSCGKFVETTKPYNINSARIQHSIEPMKGGDE
jgi:hypothetical protein